MKCLMFLSSILLVVSCGTTEPETTEVDTPQEERSIGFLVALPDSKWHLGQEDAIQIVKDLDDLWSNRDYAAMKTMFVDTASFYCGDGRTASSPDGFIEILMADDEESEDSWTFDYAFSVDLDPSTGGEHVQAGFTGTSVKDGVETNTRYHESYYIREGKIVWWNQFTQAVEEEGEEQ